MKDSLVYLIFDVILLAPLGWGAYIGFRRGLLAEVVSILHFAIAFIICFKVAGFALGLLNKYVFIFDKNLYPKLAFVGGALLAGFLLDKIGDHFKTEIDYDFPGSWDNIIGGVIGLLKFAIVMMFVVWALTGAGSFNNKIQEKSYLHGVFTKLGKEVAGKKNRKDLDEMIKNSM
ncbi:MAG TPA: hypothetical protein DCS93_17705 [Microscillaceae bacterium]|nr:hypothetical protein [Microscillaceae bacterium]